MSRTVNLVDRPHGLAFPVTGIALAALFALALASGAHAQAPASTPPATPSSPQSPADQGKAATAPSAAAPAAAGTSAADAPAAATNDSASGSTTKHPPVCFKLTGRCVESPKGAAATKAKSGTGNKHPLNLTAPDVRTVVSADELKEPLPTNDQIVETQEAQTVSVKGDSGVPPDVPGGFGALWWALNHPSQAWRILTPAE